MSPALIPVKLHAHLGASSCARWWACPGSVRACETVPKSPDTDHSREGTCAHAVAQLALTRSVDPAVFVGSVIEGWEVDEDMALHVPVFVDYCTERLRDAKAHETGFFGVETQFSLAPLSPPEPMYGTADFWCYDPELRLLDIADLKYGAGVIVDVFENKQLCYYALGALLALIDKSGGCPCPVEIVRLAIIQPRAGSEPVRLWSITLDELLGFANDLLDAARRTQQPDAPLVAGSHCRFCPAAAVCPELRRFNEETAMAEFASKPLDVPPDPATLSDALLAEIMAKLPILEAWANSVRGHVFGKLERGEDVPGWKLVPRRANRRWVDEAHTRQWLEAQGHAGEAILVERLKSPAQIERLVGKKALPSEMTVKESRGLSLVPDTDSRQAVAAGPDHDFDVLTAGPQGIA